MKNSIRELFRLFRSLRRAQREGRVVEFAKAAGENARIQQIMMRPMTHDVTNGSGEIGLGSALLCFALSSYTASLLPNWAWRGAIGMLFLVGACLAMPVSRWAIKRYVTWPRTGYVAFQRSGAFWVSMVVTAVVAVVISVALVHLMRPEMTNAVKAQVQAQWQPSAPAEPGTLSPMAKVLLLGLGPLYALLYLMLNAVSIREHRWKWLLVVLLVLGSLAIGWWVPGNYFERSRPLILFLGLVCFISGGVTLISFLRHHPVPPVEAE